jgi:hypothetical protein
MRITAGATLQKEYAALSNKKGPPFLADLFEIERQGKRRP